MRNKIGPLVVSVILMVSCKNGASDVIQTGKSFPVYGGNKAGNRYSPLDQINTGNVQNLQVAWKYFVNED